MGFFGMLWDKIKSIIFARRIAEEAAREAAEKEARKKKTIVLVCILVGVLLVGTAVAIYYLSKNPKVRAEWNSFTNKVKSFFKRKKHSAICTCDVAECD